MRVARAAEWRQEGGRHTAVVRSFRTVRAQRLRRFHRGVAVAAAVVVRLSFPASFSRLSVVPRVHTFLLSLFLSRRAPTRRRALRSVSPGVLFSPAHQPRRCVSARGVHIYATSAGESAPVSQASFLTRQGLRHRRRRRRLAVPGGTPAHRYEVSAAVHLTAIHRASVTGLEARSERGGAPR